MSNIITTPNMNLTLPIPSLEPGPLYASDINNSLTIVDQHNHSDGSGVQITPSGLNINSDFPINGNNLTLVRTLRLQPQSSGFTPGVVDLGALYEVVGDLYYVDGSGNQIRITESGSVAGAAGTITGLPSGTASAAYTSSTFVFQSATATPAAIDGASFILRNNVASSFGLTLSPPSALASNYSLVLPSLPPQTNVITLDTSGNMGTLSYDQIGEDMTSAGANAIAASRTRESGTNSVPIGGVAISPSSGSFGTGSVSYVGIPGQSVTIATSGRPVRVFMSPISAVSSLAGVGLSGTNTSSMFIQLTRNTVSVAIQQVAVSATSSSNTELVIPPGSVSFLDDVAAGTYTYSFNVLVSSGSNGSFVNINTIAYEL